MNRIMRAACTRSFRVAAGRSAFVRGSQTSEPANGLRWKKMVNFADGGEHELDRVVAVV